MFSVFLLIWYDVYPDWSEEELFMNIDADFLMSVLLELSHDHYYRVYYHHNNRLLDQSVDNLPDDLLSEYVSIYSVVTDANLLLPLNREGGENPASMP